MWYEFFSLPLFPQSSCAFEPVGEAGSGNGTATSATGGCYSCGPVNPVKGGRLSQCSNCGTTCVSKNNLLQLRAGEPGEGRAAQPVLQLRHHLREQEQPVPPLRKHDDEFELIRVPSCLKLRGVSQEGQGLPQTGSPCLSTNMPQPGRATQRRPFFGRQEWRPYEDTPPQPFLLPIAYSLLPIAYSLLPLLAQVNSLFPVYSS